MPNASVVGPFGEGDFAEEFGLDPVHGAPLSGAHAFCLGACQNRLGRFDFAAGAQPVHARSVIEKPVPTFPA